MAYIKKLVMQGFKSFAKRTEIVFDKGNNVILGPNGSGKSNISDALCFVLGRLSIKSMRASKARNLLFMGSKYIKPAREASVELVFDNSDRVFGMDRDEIILSRTVKYNGQGVYKINGETKTRVEIIELLAHAGIDPHGFNLVLQGQIQAIVKMHPDERRKIIEEVAGISIYEARKEKSLHELAKTEEKLKEINAILREKSAYLKNLEKERSQALRFKELETTVKRAKAAILQKNITEKNKEIGNIESSISEKSKQRDSIRENSDALYAEVEQLNQKIQEINKTLQRATGVEQETLHSQVANLKAELEGLRVRKEGYENRRIEFERRIQEMQKTIPELESEIRELSAKSPLVAKKNDELKKKKEELAALEEEKKRFHTLKTEIFGIKERIRDKERALSRAQAEAETALKQIEEYTRLCAYQSEKECQDALSALKSNLQGKRSELEGIGISIVQAEKIISISEAEIERSEKIKEQVAKLDVCPLCQSTITPEHIQHVVEDADSKIDGSKQAIKDAEQKKNEVQSNRMRLSQEISEIDTKLRAAEIELIRQRTMKEKQELLKRTVSEEQSLKKELATLEERRVSLETKLSGGASIEEQYDSKIAEIEEISSRTEQNLDTTLMYKQRELENIANIVKRSQKDKEDIEKDVAGLSESIETKAKSLAEKEKQERELTERFKKLFEERDKMQHEVQEKNIEASEMQNSTRQIEDQMNYLKIGIAKLDAERQTLELEIKEYSGIEPLQGSIAYLQERLAKSQETLREIGAINMRALEVYDEIKKEYDFVAEKTDTLTKEKEQIMAIIDEIDKKKVRSFMKTFRGLNELFTQNFSKVYMKGQAFLEIENPEDVFAGGVTIAVKLAKGKYFDVTSLSGGEQTLVALSLLFAIQEYRPYHFYVFDEIDAALDKRNSERLAGLISQYMKSGQYIIITHNDSIILSANVLYGVSMHEGVSKVLSLHLGEKMPQQEQQAQEQRQEPADGIESIATSQADDSEKNEDESKEIEELFEF